MLPAPLELQNNEYVRASWEGRPYGELGEIETASVHDGTQIAVLVNWASAQANTGAGEGFPDAAAIAFPVRGEPILHQMGSKETPIHFLQWLARGNIVRSVLAEGMGSSRTGGAANEAVAAGWSAGRWSVVFTRTLKGSPDVSGLVAGAATTIGFAVWDGGNEERAGIKAVSVEWTDLEIEG